MGSTNEDDGDGPGRLLGGQSGRCGYGHDDINVERNQFGCKSGEPLDLPLGTSVFDHEVAALDVPEVTQSLTEGHVKAFGRFHDGTQDAYSSDFGRLLRLRGERRGEEATRDQCHEGAARHLEEAGGVHGALLTSARESISP